MADKQKKWKSGDVVKLPSGGPAMTVESITEDRVACAWFVNGRVEARGFYVESLVAAEADDGNPGGETV